MSDERQQAVRRYLVVIQDERGYPPPGEQDEAPPDGPAPPMMHTAVLAADYDALHAALEAERGLREKAEQERDEAEQRHEDLQRQFRIAGAAFDRRTDELDMLRTWLKAEELLPDDLPDPQSFDRLLRERLTPAVVERAEHAEQRAAEASRRLEEAEAALVSEGHGDAGGFHRGDHVLAASCPGCQALARESSEGVSSGPDGTDESERSEHG
jgi:hypothetical protein